jgi:signal peptidase
VTTVQELPNKEVRILTKGDNNPVDDRGLYPKGQLWLKEEHVMGQIVG